MTEITSLCRPIIGIENRTAQEAFDIMAYRIRAALSSRSAEAGKPVVKVLEWRVFCSRSGNCEAKTPFGEYVIQSETDGWCLYLLNSDDIHAAHSTLDFAKAAAQADYESRVRSALSTPADIEPIGYVSVPELGQLKMGVSCVDLFSEPQSGGINFAPVYAAPVAEIEPVSVPDHISPHAFAQEYEFRGDTDYTPNDGERAMIEDAIHGYLAAQEERS